MYNTLLASKNLESINRESFLLPLWGLGGFSLFLVSIPRYDQNSTFKHL